MLLVRETAAVPSRWRTVSMTSVRLTVLRRRRYLEARVAWGRVVSHCRNVLRQSSLWLNDIDAGER